MKYRVFVDGQAGTTGLKINDYLSARQDIEILTIEPEKRKDPDAKQVLLNSADVVFLCLPDEAARQSVSLVTNPNTRVIDPSTAHRTDPDWVYGIPELNKTQRDKICQSKRVAVPGCHATGFIMALYPLISKDIVSNDYPITCSSITGYSGGGRSMIQQYEDKALQESLQYPMHYALGLNHKHLPEMQYILGLQYQPVFSPVVSNFYKGMVVSIPLFTHLLNKHITPNEIRDILADHYDGEQFVRVMPYTQEERIDGGLEGCNNTNRIDLFVFGNSERILLVSRLDNLGKGASGAAVQNMNIMLGIDEETGL